eukprot:1014840-Pleurochrysis_carterae.AAC.1
MAESGCLDGVSKRRIGQRFSRRQTRRLVCAGVCDGGGRRWSGVMMLWEPGVRTLVEVDVRRCDDA